MICTQSVRSSRRGISDNEAFYNLYEQISRRRNCERQGKASAEPDDVDDYFEGDKLML